MSRRWSHRRRGTTRYSYLPARPSAVSQCQSNVKIEQQASSTYCPNIPGAAHVRHHHEGPGDQDSPDWHARATLSQTLRDELGSCLASESESMQNSSGNVHGVDATGECREDENGVEEVGGFWHPSLDSRNDEYRARAHRRCVAVDEGMVRRDNKRGREYCKRVEGDDAEVDFPGRHFHGLYVGKRSALGSRSSNNVHADVRE